MKTVVFFVFYATIVFAQPPPMGPPPCPSGVAQSKCDAFFACMPRPQHPPPMMQGSGQGGQMQQPPMPSLAQQAELELAEKQCFQQAGMNSNEQSIMQANRPKPGQGPPPPCFQPLSNSVQQSING